MNPHNQQEINAEVERRKKLNEDYIKELKASGEYGKSAGHITISLQEDPLFDDPMPKRICESYSYAILDMSNLNLPK